MLRELAFAVFADRARPISSAQQTRNVLIYTAKSEPETFRSTSFFIVSSRVDIIELPCSA